MKKEDKNMAFQVKVTKATRMKCAASIQVEGLSGRLFCERTQNSRPD